MKNITKVLIAFLLALAFAGSALAANWNTDDPPHTHVTWNS